MLAYLVRWWHSRTIGALARRQADAAYQIEQAYAEARRQMRAVKVPTRWWERCAE